MFLRDESDLSKMDSINVCQSNFYVVKYVQRNIYHINLFQVYSSVGLSTFTWCNYHYYPFPEIFHHPKLKVYTH